MCLDPVTMKPDRLLYRYWHLTEQAAGLVDYINHIVKSGMCAVKAEQLKQARLNLKHVDHEIEQAEVFISIANLSGMEIYA